jgi:hypothetical protein
MQDEKWEELKEETKRKFEVEKIGKEDLTMEVENELIKQGFAEFMIFNSPLGRIKLSRESRPKVLDKKFIYSHRAGDSARTEYEFSDTELTHKLKVYKSNDDDEWQEIDAETFSG